jgi:beta-glucosidase/6-phospho-beta-glucosidase/beta-galactosidase
MEKEKDEYLKNMTALQRNSHDLAASAKAIQMMSKYKQKVEVRVCSLNIARIFPNSPPNVP